jgi:uncharacterized coiled-coil DUF342 family protein
MDEKWHLQKHLDIDTTLKEHDDDIQELKEDSREFKTEIKNLCDNLKNLTSALWGVIILFIGALATYFFTSR